MFSLFNHRPVFTIIVIIVIIVLVVILVFIILVFVMWLLVFTVTVTVSMSILISISIFVDIVIFVVIVVVLLLDIFNYLLYFVFMIFCQLVNRDGCYAVSYTHLDVYKRQMHSGSIPPPVCFYYLIFHIPHLS